MSSPTAKQHDSGCELIVGEKRELPQSFAMRTADDDSRVVLCRPLRGGPGGR